LAYPQAKKTFSTAVSVSATASATIVAARQIPHIAIGRTNKERRLNLIFYLLIIIIIETNPINRYTKYSKI